MPIHVPPALAAHHDNHSGAEGRAWITALPRLAADLLDHWNLRPDGPARHGMVSLVLPVRRPDGTPAALKLQPTNEENDGEPVGLRAWNGDAIVRLLDHDPATGTMLLERLDATRPLSEHPDPDTAVSILADLLARLVAHPAPPTLRRLADIAAAMLDTADHLIPTLPDAGERRLLRTCATAMTELLDEPGDRLLHWDLHYDNVLAADREPWLAIDPKPLAGDPGFDLMPALDNRWHDITTAPDIPHAILRRFDHLTEALTLDRARATTWTLARVLQNCLWDIADGTKTLDPVQVTIAEALLAGPRSTTRPPA
ncbi:aminoglycoside phosphotransferase family protein [Actinokineospora enzanensis]|uniref:aminoglycoside phosphotransferase family protein n=1 Tax=Actinokineospora enzanensis TaxID=155975 RepID=UPI000362B85F|nr:aminoglycoside phosphotransferase family protein [Actinokineospora enzanensis]